VGVHGANHAVASHQERNGRGRRHYVRFDRPGRLEARDKVGELDVRGKGAEQFEIPYGHTLVARLRHGRHAPHVRVPAPRSSKLAEIAVSARYKRLSQPDAYYRDLITIDDVRTRR